MVFTNILFPVDFSERCRAAAPCVRAVKAKSSASLTLVNFVETPVMWYGSAEAPCMPDFNTPKLIEEARHRLTFFSGDCFPGMDVNLVAEAGDPGSCIVEMARTSNIDLIMMPTRGQGRFRAALLGSVTAKVLHDAECPVWTAAHSEDQENGVSAEWRTILCAIDTSPDALCLIRRAAQLRDKFGVSIRLVHAIPGAEETRPEKYFDHDFDAFLAESAEQTIAQMQKSVGTDFPVAIRRGKIHAAVAAAAHEIRADLVLIGRGSLPHFGGRLRTHAYAIIRDVPCPVLSF